MKQAALNLFFALIAFILVYGIALLTGLPVIQEAVLIAFIIQWICFIPAYFFQTEKFYDLAGSCTYLFMVGYVSFTSYSSLNLNTASILLASCIALWAIRLGTFLFLRIHRAKEYKRFKKWGETIEITSVLSPTDVLCGDCLVSAKECAHA